MARVDHKLVKRLMDEERSRITDRQFLTSRALAGHFEDMAAAQTRRYGPGRRIRVLLSWDTSGSCPAYTDNEAIHINAGHPLVTGTKGRRGRYQVLCGLFAHELGHLLYTDFLGLQTHQAALGEGRWHPATPELATPQDRINERTIRDYIGRDPANRGLVQKAAHTIANILEDGHIENRLPSQFPGTLGYGLERMRERVWEQIPDMTQLKEKEEDGHGHAFSSILQAALSYALYGEIKYGEEPLADERIQAVFGLLDQIDLAVESRDPRTRMDMANTVMVRLWSHMEGYLEEAKKRAKDAGATAERLLGERLGGMAGTTTAAAGLSHRPIAAAETEAAGPATTAAGRTRTRRDAEESKAAAAGPAPEPPGETGGEADGDENAKEAGAPHGSPEDGSTGAENGAMGAKPCEEPGNKAETAGEDSAPGAGSPEEDGQTEENEDGSAKEGEALERAEEDDGGAWTGNGPSAADSPAGGGIQHAEGYEHECNERAASDIERILDGMAERSARRQLENERLKELNDAAQNISYGNIHGGVRIRINRIASTDGDLEEQYRQASGPLLRISRQMQKAVASQLKEARRGGKLTGLYMGRRLDAHALCRNDGRIFYKNSLPADTPEMAVGLLLDESGSMSCDGRSAYARATAIILHDFCQGLGIPAMAYGHSTGNGTVELYSYAEFEAIDRNDRYRMMDIHARRNNRDGAALRYVAERLLERPEDVKLLMIVSDGQPADAGYCGAEAEEDLRGIRREYQKKGVIFVAAAIGDDKPAIERIYGDSFLDITDLEKLPAKLAGVIKRHLRM